MQRCGLRHALVTKNNHKEKHWGGFRLPNARGLENLKRKLDQILSVNLNMRHFLRSVVIRNEFFRDYNLRFLYVIQIKYLLLLQK